MKTLCNLFLLSFLLLVPSLSAEELLDEKARIYWQIQQIDKNIIPKLQEISKKHRTQAQNKTDLTLKLIQTEKELKNTIDNNIKKTFISGGLAVALELFGSSNAGKVIDLGTWVVGKGIGLGMEKSAFFSGPAYYERKTKLITKEYNGISSELKQLYETSKMTDEMIQSHYNKNKKNNLYDNDLGTLATIQYRMKLTLSKMQGAINSVRRLKYSHLKLSNQAIKDIERSKDYVKFLRERYDELNKPQEEKQKKEVALSLSNYKTEIKPVRSNISINFSPNNCVSVLSTANSLINNHNTLKLTYNKLYAEYIKILDEYYNDQKRLYEEINIKHARNMKKISDNSKDSAYTSGDKYYYPYAVPFDKILSDTNNRGNQRIKARESNIESLKSFVITILDSVPDKNIENELNKIITDMAKIVDLYKSLIRRYRTSDCNLNYSILINPYWFENPNSIIDKLKEFELNIRNKIRSNQNELESSKIYFKELMPKLRRYLKEAKNRMEDNLNEYIENEKEIIAFYKSYINLQRELLKKYENKSMFEETSREYVSLTYKLKQEWLINNMKENEPSCKLIENMKNKLINSSIIEIIIMNKELTSKHATKHTRLSIPTYAEVHFPSLAKNAKNLESISKRLWSERMRFNPFIRSNTEFIYENIINNRIAQLGIFQKGIFQTIHDKQTKTALGIINVLKNTLVVASANLSKKRIHKSSYKNNKSIYDSQLKKFKDELACLGEDEMYNKKIIPMLEDLKKIVSKLKMKPIFINVDGLIIELESFKKEVEDFGIRDTKEYEKQYKNLLEKYEVYKKEVNSKKEEIFSLDFEKLQKLLNKIYPLFEAQRYQLEDKNNLLAEDRNTELIKELYENFEKNYSNKNLSSLMSLISDDWESTSDGTTLMDLEDTLDNSFSVFDEINCSIENLDIYKLSTNKYQISYVISIKGFIYDNDIEHFEKSSVKEEVIIENNKARISKTLNGNFWPSR